MPPNDERIGKLRREKAKSTPEIYGHNWGDSLDAGWRWYRNYPLDEIERAVLRLRSLIREHGQFNVTFGQPWNEEKFTPGPIVGHVGLYIRDVAAQVAEFRAALDDFEGVE